MQLASSAWSAAPAGRALVLGQLRSCPHLLGRIVRIGLISDLKGHLPVVKYPVPLSCKKISVVSASPDAQGDCAKWVVVLPGWEKLSAQSDPKSRE
jgi:hypothetical protein